MFSAVSASSYRAPAVLTLSSLGSLEHKKNITVDQR